MKLCFDIYDIDSDGIVSEGNLLELIEKLSDDMFLSVYSYDIMKFVAYFETRDHFFATSGKQKYIIIINR